MKQLFQMFFFDIKMNFKSVIGIFMLIMPMIILLVLSTFLPGVESTTMTFAVVTSGPNAVDPALLEVLSVADIKTYDTIEAMEQKLREVGAAEGLYWDPDAKQYVSVLERSIANNKVFSTAAKYIRQYYYQQNYPEAPRITEFSYGVPPELDTRTRISPVASMGGAIFLVFLVIINAFLIGMGVVNDKEYGTDKALQVTPVSKADYFIGKSLFPLIIAAAYTIIALMILKLLHVNILQVYVVVLASFVVTLFFGLLIGALAKNETESVGVGKLLSMLLMLSILGGTLLPSAWQWVVWWSPVYWMYDVLNAIFTEVATWNMLAWKTGILVGLTCLYFILLRKKIIKGLS